jgi:hypothetical protein
MPTIIEISNALKKENEKEEKNEKIIKLFENYSDVSSKNNRMTFISKLITIVVGFSIYNTSGCDNRNSQTGMDISNYILLLTIYTAFTMFFFIVSAILYKFNKTSLVFIYIYVIVEQYIFNTIATIIYIIGLIILYSDNFPCLLAGSGKVWWVFVSHIFQLLKMILVDIKKNVSNNRRDD